jgi:hypothetical protein
MPSSAVIPAREGLPRQVPSRGRDSGKITTPQNSAILVSGFHRNDVQTLISQQRR